MDRGEGGDAERVALPSPHGHAPVEPGALGRLQVDGAEEVRDLARHVDGDRQLRSRGLLTICGGVLGQEVGDGGADGAAADAVVASQGGDGPALQVCGAHVVGFVDRDVRAAPALVALALGGPESVVRQLPLEVEARLLRPHQHAVGHSGRSTHPAA